MLELGDLLGGQFALVFLLDLGQPSSTLLRLTLVELDFAAIKGFVDLFEQSIHELCLRDLSKWLAVGVDQALVLRSGNAKVGVRGLSDAIYGAAKNRDLNWLLISF